MELLNVLVQTSAASVRLSVPLLFTALAGLFAERSGVFDIGLEGKVLISAFAAASAAYATRSAWIGLLAAMATSTSFSMLHGFVSITNRGDQTISGVAINFVTAGAAPLLGMAWFGLGGWTPSLAASNRFMALTLPFADQIRSVPVIGTIYSGLASGHNILVYLAFATVPLTWWIFQRTRFGLRLRAVGENPGAVDSAGVSVSWLRYRALACNGVLCGCAGAYLSVAQSNGFIPGMSAGKGYIALAALVFSKWRPWNVLLTCLLFGFLDAVSIRIQGTVLPGIGVLPVQFVQALPCVLTVLLLAGFVGPAIPPKSSGLPYLKER
jgi:general nucleoside transport system permease protein